MKDRDVPKESPGDRDPSLRFRISEAAFGIADAAYCTFCSLSISF